MANTRLSTPRSVWQQLRWNFCVPEYVFQPAQLVRRARRTLAQQRTPQNVHLPWGPAMTLAPRDLLTRSIFKKNVYDLVLSESVWRLLDPGELALDVGANIGYVTSIMAARVGAAGRVLAFEPHPLIVEELRANVARWSGASGLAPITVRSTALSDHSGSGDLLVPHDWDGNRGIATVVPSGHEGPDGTTVAITLERLDDLLEDRANVGLAKLDVEGHEAAVLRGASALLERRAIRDILFEDLFEDAGEYPTPTMRILQAAGYSLFSLAKRFWGPEVAPPNRAGVFPRNPANFLATLDVARARARLARRGWQVLSNA